MLFPYRTLTDPRSNRGNLLGRQGMARFRRRHQIIGILCGDPPEQFAAFGISGNHHAADTLLPQQTYSPIKTQSCAARSLIRAMTLETSSRKKRSNLGLKIDSFVDAICLRHGRSSGREMPEHQDREIGDQRGGDVILEATFHTFSLSMGTFNPNFQKIGTD